MSGQLPDSAIQDDSRRHTSFLQRFVHLPPGFVWSRFGYEYLNDHVHVEDDGLIF